MWNGCSDLVVRRAGHHWTTRPAGTKWGMGERCRVCFSAGLIAFALVASVVGTGPNAGVMVRIATALLSHQ
jgi:hypothetical protein